MTAVRRRLRGAPLLAAALVAVAALSGCGPTGAVRSAAPVGTAALDPALHDQLPAPVRERGSLRVATDATYPPASAFDRDGRTIVGFEPDLAAAVGRVLGVDVELVRTDFSEMLPALTAGRVDLVMSAMTDNVERRASADFVDYFTAGTAVVVQRGNPHAVTSLHDLCGKTVAVERATVQVDLLRRAQASCHGEGITVRQTRDNALALVELRTGRAAAVLNDYPPAAALTTGARTSADFQLASTAQYEPGFYGIAVRRTEPALRDALREALSRLVRSGEYAEVLDRWGVSSGAVSQVTVNAGAG